MKGDVRKDVGKVEIGSKKFVGDITSDKHRVLQNIYKIIGNSTTTLRNWKEHRPWWIVENAFDEESENN